MKKLILDENFDNVKVDVQAVADPSFVQANEEHDEDKKEYEDVLEQNREAAMSTIPEEGETGKKVKSKVLKQMHLSEAMFDEDFKEGEKFKNENDATIEILDADNDLITYEIKTKNDSIGDARMAEPEAVEEVIEKNGYEKISESMEEIDRQAFGSLNKETKEPGVYYVLRDQNFDHKIYADSDEEAKEKFRAELNENLSTDKYDNLVHELYNAMSKTILNYVWDGITKQDIENAVEESLVHFFDSDEAIACGLNESTDKMLGEEYDAKVGGDSEDFIADLNDMKTALHSISFATHRAEDIAEDLIDEIVAIKKSYKNNSLTESLSDGWDIGYSLNNVLDDINSLKYELDNCIRGSYTRCETKEEIVDYIRGLAERLSDVADDVEENNNSDDFEESLKYQIAKEQLQRFNEGKMPENWNPKLFLEGLQNKGHLSEKEVKKLSENFHVVDLENGTMFGNFDDVEDAKAKAVQYTSLFNTKAAVVDDENDVIDGFDRKGKSLKESTEGSKVINQLNKEVNRLKSRLSTKKPRENFGDNEVCKLKDKYADQLNGKNIDVAERDKISNIISNFEDWCANYTG